MIKLAVRENVWDDVVGIVWIYTTDELRHDVIINVSGSVSVRFFYLTSFAKMKSYKFNEEQDRHQ